MHIKFMLRSIWALFLIPLKGCFKLGLVLIFVVGILIFFGVSLDSQLAWFGKYWLAFIPTVFILGVSDLSDKENT